MNYSSIYCCFCIEHFTGSGKQQPMEVPMNRIFLPMLVLSLLVGWAICGCSANQKSEQKSEQAKPEEQEKAIAEIQKLGGKVTIDKDKPAKPVLEVHLSGTRVTDAGLEHLRGLTELILLNLMNTQVTDAGLEHIKGLKNLQTLNLTGTKVTDEGVKNLKQSLPKCNIVHIKAR
jgi:hypothetical protein